MGENATEKSERHRIGERLRQVRGNTSQGDFSKTFGINQNTISRYERGERTPDIEFVSMICRATGVNPRWLVLGEEPMYDADASQERPRVKGKDFIGKDLNELPADLQKTVRRTFKAFQARKHEWEQLPEWAREEIEELTEQNERLEAELAQVRTEVLKAKDEALKAKDIALDALRDSAREIAKQIAGKTMEELEAKGSFYTLHELFEAFKAGKTPEDIEEELYTQGPRRKSQNAAAGEDLSPKAYGSPFHRK